MKIKDDINFLQNPNWVVAKKEVVKHLVIHNEFGSYEMTTACELGLPVRLDKTVLYFLKHKLLENNLASLEVDTTRYEIAKNVFSNSGSFSQAKYQRLMESLKKWQLVSLFFWGSFYERDGYSDKKFSIIDDFEINSKKRLIIRFNETYVRQLRETECYKIFNFAEYKNLITPVALRLYEILLKNFYENGSFYIDIRTLAEKLTIKKKSYDSQIVASIGPAVEEINSNTNLNIQFFFEKRLSLCVFRKSL